MDVEDHLEQYRDLFQEEPIYTEELLDYFSKKDYNSLLLTCYEQNRINLFKYVYLMTNAAFPVDVLIDFQSKVFTMPSSKWETTTIIYSKEEDLIPKSHMIQFIVNCKAYSLHSFRGKKCFYSFHYNRYKHRIADLLREC